ncbi:hypothetical protein LOTGIDRAFT_141139, partial [Lottia gigantea]
LTFFRCIDCNENLAKYTCPRCMIKTCSLMCVKKHKLEKDCNGVRDKTAYISINKFSETDLLSDYRLLEDTARKVSNANRDDLRLRKDRPHPVNQLIKMARERQTDLKVLPYPMSRRKTNSTRYLFRDKEISWKVDLIFPQANVSYTETRVNEKRTIEEILIKYISQTESDPVIRQKLKQYVNSNSDDYKIFLLVENRPTNDTRYCELDKEKSIKDNLCGKTIVENPSLYIVLKDEWSEYPLLSHGNIYAFISIYRAITIPLN